MKYRLALIGKPVYHSMSPDIYAEIFMDNNTDGEFSVFEISDVSEIRTLVSQRGLNAFAVTMPYKRSIFGLLDDADENAAFLRAVNFVTVESGRLIGHNTDGAGFINGLKSAGVSIDGKRVLIHGCGGAAAALCYALKNAGAICSVCGRNDAHIKDFCKAHGIEADNLNNACKYDIFINATPLGMKGHDDYTSFDFLDNAKDGFIVCDLVYSPRETKLLSYAESCGYAVQNGLPMLTEQAKAAFDTLQKSIRNT